VPATSLRAALIDYLRECRSRHPERVDIDGGCFVEPYTRLVDQLEAGEAVELSATTVHAGCRRAGLPLPVGACLYRLTAGDRLEAVR
jgi:mannose-6-phosphate isomerase class I